MRLLLGRCLGGATAAAALAFVAIAVYGLTRGPAAPIHPSPDGLRDRLGNRYTAAEYADYTRWKGVFFGAGAAVFLFGFSWAAVSKKDRREPGEMAPADAAVLRAAIGRIERHLPGVGAELRAYGAFAKLPENPEQPAPKPPPGA